MLLVFASCGYQVGGLMPHGIETVAVPIFKNQTLYRGYEFSLTWAVGAEILTQTPLRLTSASYADTILDGEIVRIRQNTVTKDENRLATQLDVVLTVAVEWKDQRSGKPILPRQILSETMEIATARGENVQQALNQALRKLARRIVYMLEDSHLLPSPNKNKG